MMSKEFAKEMENNRMSAWAFVGLLISITGFSFGIIMLRNGIVEGLHFVIGSSIVSILAIIPFINLKRGEE